MQESLCKRGTLIVAVMVVAAVVGSVMLVLGGDDRSSTPVESAVAARVTGDAPNPAAGEEGFAASFQANDAAPADARPQGRLAPDSNEGQAGVGSQANIRATPGLNPAGGGDISNTAAASTGGNAPADPSAQRQDAPTGSLTSGPNRDPAPTAPVR